MRFCVVNWAFEASNTQATAAGATAACQGRANAAGRAATGAGGGAAGSRGRGAAGSGNKTSWCVWLVTFSENIQCGTTTHNQVPCRPNWSSNCERQRRPRHMPLVQHNRPSRRRQRSTHSTHSVPSSSGPPGQRWHDCTTRCEWLERRSGRKTLPRQRARQRSLCSSPVCRQHSGH